MLWHWNSVGLMDRKLTFKQQKFVDLYKGNATEAAKLAGYKGNRRTLGQVGDENLKKPRIWNAIQKRIDKPDKKILSREELQEFWTKIVNEKIEETKDRLKASELLGKSQAAFTENRAHLFPKQGTTMAEGLKQIAEHFKSNPELEDKLLEEAEG